GKSFGAEVIRCAPRRIGVTRDLPDVHRQQVRGGASNQWKKKGLLCPGEPRTSPSCPTPYLAFRSTSTQYYHSFSGAHYQSAGAQNRAWLEPRGGHAARYGCRLRIK